MSDIVTEVPSLTPEEQQAAQRLGEKHSNTLVNKIKILNMQMESMDKKEKLKYSGQFDALGKAMAKLRKALRQRMPANSWQWTIYVSVALLIVIYAFFGYKLYKSLVERDRKRQEKLKAKQSKKKK